MMKYLLVEDERFAYEEMKRMMEKLRPDYQLEAWTATVEQTVQFLKHHPGRSDVAGYPVDGWKQFRHF